MLKDGIEIRTQRRGRNIRQGQFAALVGIPKQVLSAFELNLCSTPEDILEKAETVLIDWDRKHRNAKTSRKVAA
jgi:DNA-binding transcriptional regulator YiaG